MVTKIYHVSLSIVILLLITSDCSASVSPICVGGCGPNGQCVLDAYTKASICVCRVMYAPDHGIPPPEGTCRVSPSTVGVTVVFGVLILALMAALIYILVRGCQERRAEHQQDLAQSASTDVFR